MPQTDQQRLQNLMAPSLEKPLWQALQSLRSCMSFMNTGAHPDDETTSMLAALSLRDGVKISQACANRGEGGQNNIDAQSGAALGALRTREMERAAAVINMTHYWLSQSPDDTIFDFGFSKSGIETLTKWDENHTLKRFVAIIRNERPDIICPTFLDISGQHGHHQAMTRCAFRAVELASDPEYLPELDVWQVKKLYLPAWSGAGDAYDDDVPPPPETVQVDASGADPVYGADYAQIAQYSRSFHKTQGMGNWVEAGKPNRWPLNLAWEFKGQLKPENSIFDDLPRTLTDLANIVAEPRMSDLLTQAQQHMDNAITAWPHADEIRQHTVAALNQVQMAIMQCPNDQRSEIIHRLKAKTQQLSKVIMLSLPKQPYVSLSSETALPGGQIMMEIHSTLPNLTAVPVLPNGWTARAIDNNSFEISIAKDALPSDPYPDIWRPETANEPLHVMLEWQENNTSIIVNLDPETRLIIAPNHTIALSQKSAIVNLQSLGPVRLEVNGMSSARGKIEIPDQPGWKTSLNGNWLELMPDSNINPGLYKFPLSLDGKPAMICNTSSYEHTGKVQLCQPAVVSIQVVDIHLPKGKVAYIGGGNDTVDHWLRKLGVTLKSITQEQLSTTDLSEFDTILIGVFAMRSCETLAKRLPEIHDWVRSGGNLVTLYHRPWDNWNVEKTPLAPLTIGAPSLRWRITDETAKVTHLLPDHVLLNVPNRVVSADWQGWFKERGLYFASQWVTAYQPLLQMADPDENPLRGGLLSGEFGKGHHTHTSLTLHLQAQNLVPGGLKLLANLLHNSDAAE